MDNRVRRIFVEKKEGMNVEALGILADLRDNLGISGLKRVRLLNRYDVQGLEDSEYEAAKTIVFSNPIRMSYTMKLSRRRTETVCLRLNTCPVNMTSVPILPLSVSRSLPERTDLLSRMPVFMYSAEQ